ncbi:MAG: hypothetical protein MUC56_15095 [Thermoanaerobaculales bacterium]|jgi:hypothetical protein|nr:hypothetical protein [Thermoanaerobaculales bacterium]
MAPPVSSRSHRIEIAARRISAVLALVLSTGYLPAAEPPGARHAAFQEVVKRGPVVHGRIPHLLVNRQLHAAFHSALNRIQGLESCRDLFENLGADGFQVLADTTYVYADTGPWRSVCDRACAFTTVGGPAVGLCVQFGRISTAEATLVLIHEALHGAGLGEQPHDPNGLAPDEIDEMVRNACGF